jgi:hypothetical protein
MPIFAGADRGTPRGCTTALVIGLRVAKMMFVPVRNVPSGPVRCHQHLTSPCQ